ncbi:Ig-like domain-containing protein [Azohydromonas lata]|uniref:Ig-like domain-containing protein n=1 Tax=Azohydromonas lata TaxID=45677 RepID=UPI000AC81984|nr:hypothetical protein [Azohydromonas lata]
MKKIWAMAAAMLLALGGCGGGDDAATAADTGAATEHASAVRCQATMANPFACVPKMSVALVNPAGVAVTRVTHKDPGTLRVTVRDGNGVGLRGVVVNLQSSDGSVQASAASTDATGLARLALPAGSRAGTFTARVTATAQGSSLAGAVAYEVLFPKLNLALLDAGGRAITQVSPDTAGTLAATLKYPDGTPLANSLVTFGTSDSVALQPATRTALTDAAGVARIGLPAGTRSGGFMANAAVSVNGIALTAAMNYGVTFPVLAFATPAVSPTRLSAGGTATLSFTVTNNGKPYARPLPVTFTSRCAGLQKASITQQATTRAGLAAATYTDRGCASTDTITASVTLGDRTATRSVALDVLPTTVGSIGFVSASATSIALAGTGGAQRQEWSSLRFRVQDARGNPVANVPVAFAFADNNAATTVGGLKLQPASGSTDASGYVSTTVSAGTIPTSVRVKASVGSITTLSSLLVVSSGVPDQQHFSLSTSTFNCEGRDYDQACSTVTASLADHFGNPVPDGTVVNFSAEGGVIDAFCLTGRPSAAAAVRPGSCSVKLYSAQPKPANGRVTVLAYALGEEDFFDRNGNNRCDACDTASVGAATEFTPSQDKSPDIWRDDNEDLRWTAGEPCIGPNRNGLCSTPGDRRYNGVLRSPSPAASAQTLYVSRQIVHFFSGSRAYIAGPLDPVTGATFAPRCAADEVVDLAFTVQDVNRNPVPAGTKIELSTLFGAKRGEVFPDSLTVENYPVGLGSAVSRDATTYTATVVCAAAQLGRVYVKVTTPNNVTTMGTLYINR